MNKDVDAMRAAARRAGEARSRFLADLANVGESVSPARLKAELSETVWERADLLALKAKRNLYRHRWSMAAGVSVVIAWHFRRPLAALSRRLWVEAKTLFARFEDWRHDHD